ncbi:MAG: DegV family protein [Clostridiales bacterium]|nr:DegV family protein [Clostridiales bacterium]MDO4349937.1 DegV family protein [Eubacteriales bacterium]MDY4008159.1 DegV family protein [Candidatus Limiplasma sp.]
MDEKRKTVIVTDSSCDLSDEQLSRYGIRMISLRVVCQNAEYRDRVDIQEDELYDLLTRELPKTSLPLPEDVTRLYEALAEEGVENVIHISISSGLSGTYNMVRMITEDFQDRMRVLMLDSKTLSTGLGMMVLAAAQALEAGATPEEAIEKAQSVRKTQLGMFVIRTLEFLRKGGRIGLVEGVVGSLLQIKPIIYVNDDGVYQTLAKARGYRGAVDTMVQEVKRFFGDAKVNLSVVNGKAHEDAEELMARLQEELNIAPGAFISPVSPVLAIHTGPGLLGIVANKADPA